MCLLFTVVSLTNFSWSRLSVSGARPFQRGRMLESLSKKCFFIFFKARLVPLICSTLTSSTSQAVLQAERQPKMTHSNCENSTTSEVLNSTEHSGIFSFRSGICIGLRSLMFGLFAGCFNSHLVCLDQCWETSFFYFRASNTCWVIYSLLFSHVFLFFCNLVSCTILLS